MNHLLSHRRRAVGLAVACCLLASFVEGRLAAVELRRGPYLQALHDEGVTVRWRTDAASSEVGLVRYGRSPLRLTDVVAGQLVESPVEGVREWVAEIKGLEPGTRYYYSVEVAAVTLAGGDDHHWFETFPQPDKGAKVRFWCLGDTGGNRPREVNHEQAKQFGLSDTVKVATGFERFNRDQPAHMVLLGDNAYPTGTDMQFQTALFQSYRRFLGQMPLWPCVGNHDMHPEVYQAIFSPAEDGRSGGVPSGSRLYYSAEIGDVHLIVLDPWYSWWITTPDAAHPGWQKQLEWLRRDLAASTRRFLVVVNHFPLYGDGNYDSDNSLTASLRTAVVPLFDEHGVDLVIAGHDHTYQRSYLISGAVGPRSEFDREKHVKFAGDGRDQPIVKQAGKNGGTIYVISGAGGGVRPGGAFNHPVMIPFSEHQGRPKRGIAVPSSFVFEVEGDTLRGWNVDTSGVAIDHFTLIKKPAPAEAPAAEESK